MCNKSYCARDVHLRPLYHNLQQADTMMKNRLTRRYLLLLIGAATGALLGYVYYLYVGCSSGTCAITSNPVNSTLYGAVLGALIADLFKKEKTKKSE